MGVSRRYMEAAVNRPSPLGGSRARARFTRPMRSPEANAALDGAPKGRMRGRTGGSTAFHQRRPAGRKIQPRRTRRTRSDHRKRREAQQAGDRRPGSVASFARHHRQTFASLAPFAVNPSRERPASRPLLLHPGLRLPRRNPHRLLALELPPTRRLGPGLRRRLLHPQRTLHRALAGVIGGLVAHGGRCSTEPAFGSRRRASVRLSGRGEQGCGLGWRRDRK